jgi:hypothetical protein
MTRRAACTIAAALALGTGLATPAAAFEIGVQDDGAFYGGEFDRSIALDRIEELGATTIRADVIWSFFKAHGYKQFDAMVDDAAARGIKVQFTLYGTPRYDHGDRYISYYRPSAARYAKWIGDFAHHFKGRVQRWAVWNEPNLAQFLAPLPQSAPMYRTIYEAAYKALKRADPRNKVLFGELAAQKRTFEWIRSMTGPKGAPLRLKADGFAYHPYQFFVAPGARDSRFLGLSNTPKIQTGVRALAHDGILRTPSGGTPSVYYTEFSYPLGRPYPTPEWRRTDWIPRGFLLAKRAGIKQVVYYKLFLRPAGANWNSGLLHVDGSPTPSFDALRRTRSSLVGS